MATAERIVHALNSSNLKPSDYKLVDVDMITALAQSTRHGSALVRIRDASTDPAKSCDEAAKLTYRKDWNVAIEIIWHKALGMAKRGNWRCQPEQVIKLSRLALLQYVGGKCGECSGTGLVNAQRDGTAKGAVKVCPVCNGATERGKDARAIAQALGTSEAEAIGRWMERLGMLVGAVETMRRNALAQSRERLGE